MAPTVRDSSGATARPTVPELAPTTVDALPAARRGIGAGALAPPPQGGVEGVRRHGGGRLRGLPARTAADRARYASHAVGGVEPPRGRAAPRVLQGSIPSRRAATTASSRVCAPSLRIAERR
ncbi:hypothetical protein EES47_17775 [Streptomyces sp. ADI98-12]|nr:hypothetical protein EES47_17775 [Streptomyces sp. ADI98-12]